MDARATLPSALAAALLLAGCGERLGTVWRGMDAGADTDADADADADSDADADADADGDADADAGMDAGVIWRFAAFGDSRGTYAEGGGHNAEVLGAIAAAVVAEGVDLVIYPGDLVYGSADAATLEAELLAWRGTMEPLYDAGVAVYPVRGNHDDGAVAAWHAVFAGEYAIDDAGPPGEVNLTYAVRHRNALIVGLDQYVAIHRVNQEWLDGVLAANDAPHVFVFGHEPAYAAIHTDCLDDHPEARDAFWRSIAAAGARTYFCGHDHMYNRALVHDGDALPDVYQLIVATAGAPPYTFDHAYGGDNGDASVEEIFTDTPYGYVLVEIHGKQVTLTWKKMTEPGIFVPVETWGYAVP